MSRSLLVPLVVFLVLVMVLALGFGLEDPHKLPSQLIDRPFPAFQLNDLADGTPRAQSDLPAEVHLVNVWATWCVNCLVEHPELLRITREENLPLVGVNYNDDRDKALAWLVRHEDPFRFSVADHEGRLAIDLGVYGAPETFVVDASGTIRFRYVGPVTGTVWANKIAPVVAYLRSGGDS